MLELLTFNHLEQVLKSYGQTLVDEYKKRLAENDKRASSTLINSVQFVYNHQGNKYEVNLSLVDYWKYVENGRRPGKFPPVNKILQWIRIKPILPYPDKNGRLPTENQLAFLISRKIANEGIEAGNYLEDTVDKTYTPFERDLIAALEQDLYESSDVILKAITQ